MAKMALAALALLASLGGCTYHSDPLDHAYRDYGYQDHAYQGDAWAQPRQASAGDLHGPGVPTLDPWLRETIEGRAIVTLGFRDSAHGFVSEDVAHRANIWFRRYADENRDRKITDPEIRTALVAAAGPYLR